MKRQLTAAATVAAAVLALAGCTESPQDALIRAVQATSAEATPEGIVTAAGMACEMGGMRQMAWGLGLSQNGATDAEIEATMPALRAYCDSL